MPAAYRQCEHNLVMSSKKLSAGMLNGYDAALIITDHSDYDYGFIILANKKLIIKTRNTAAKVRKRRGDRLASLVIASAAHGFRGVAGHKRSFLK